MADLSINAASVFASAGTNFLRGTAAAAITAGQVIAKDANGALILADANGSAEAKIPIGIACNGGGIGQPINYVTADPNFTPGSTVTAGAVYVLSGTPGSIAAAADLASGFAAIVIGVGLPVNKLNFSIVRGGEVA